MGGEAGDTLAGKRLLAVDDDAEVRAMVVAVLRARGADTDEAASANDAVAMIATDDYDCIVLDWNLADLRAETFLQRAEAARAGTTARIVVVTGDLIARSERHACEDHGLPLVRKPFRPAELLDAVRRVVGA